MAVRSSLELSFRALTPVQRVVLSRLATLDGADARVWMIAALADLGMVEAEALVDDLIAANLLADTGRDTTGQRALVMHDLVRDYARERSRQDDSEEHDAALARFLGAWLTVAERAESMLGQRYFPPPRSAERRWRPEGLGDAMFEAPKLWYSGNRAGLISAVRLACESGHTETASTMAALFTSFFAAYSDWSAWRRTHDAVLEASGGLDPYALRGLGELELCLNRHPEALARLTEARSRLEAHGDYESVAYVLVLLGVTRRKMGNLRSAARYFSLAARLFDELGNARGRAHIDLERGVQRMYQFQFPAAISHLQDAHDGLRAVGDVRAVAWSRYWLGAAHRMRERVPEARRWLTAAEEGFTRLSDRASVALCLRELAELLRLEGKLDESAALLVRALATFRELAEPSGEMLALHGLGNVLGETNPDRGIAVLARAARMARKQGRPATEKRITDDLDNLRGKRSQPVPDVVSSAICEGPSAG